MAVHYEDAEQEALFDWAERMANHFPQLRMMYHPANGGKRPGKTAAKLKRMGVKRGVPDIHFPIAYPPYHGFWAELKAVYPDGTTGDPTPDQLAWVQALQNAGHSAGVYYGWVSVAQALLQYMGVQDWDRYLEGWY